MFTLPNLPYAHDALVPHIDKATMEIHHGKHHNAYVTNLNNAIKDTDMAGKTIEELLATISKCPAAVRNNGGGQLEHTMFLALMAPKLGGAPTRKIAGTTSPVFCLFDAF